MKPLTIKIANADELKAIETALNLATGKQKSLKQAKFLFINEDFSVNYSNEDVAFQKRVEHDITVIDAVQYLQQFANENPIFNKSANKVKLHYSVDSGIKDQFESICRHHGYKYDDRIQRLIEADIAARVRGEDITR